MEEILQSERNNCIKKICEDLYALGVKTGDTLLVHASYKSMGAIEGGAKTFFEALISYLGDEGTLVMPALSFDSVTFENPYFKAKETPSCIGYLPEYFRTSVEGVRRSLHATHSCCAIGRNAEELLADHELDETPVGEHSPFRKLPNYDGKILFVGCSSDHNTSMHGVEELADPPYWVNRDQRVNYTIEDEHGNQMHCLSYRHGFVVDGKHIRQRYSRIEGLLDDGEITRGKLLMADCTLMSAKAVWSKGVEKMKNDPWYFVDKP